MGPTGPSGCGGSGLHKVEFEPAPHRAIKNFYTNFEEKKAKNFFRLECGVHVCGFWNIRGQVRSTNQHTQLSMYSNFATSSTSKGQRQKERVYASWLEKDLLKVAERVFPKKRGSHFLKRSISSTLRPSAFLWSTAQQTQVCVLQCLRCVL